jgi:hypothetical protein
MLYTTACTNLATMPKQTLLAMFYDTPTGDFLNKIPYNSWDVLSFNPTKLEVCVRITRTIDSENINDNIAALRTQLAGTTDPQERRTLEQSIRTLLTKLDNPPQFTITLTLPQIT